MRARRRSRNLRVSTILIVPMLLVTIATVAYGTLSSDATVALRLRSVDIDPRISNYWVTEYCGYGCTITVTNSNKTVTVTDNLLFPGWRLNLTIEIENNSTMSLTFNYTISYLNSTDWIEINATRLYELTGIQYDDGFYLDQTCQTSIPADFVLEPNGMVYKKEHLSFSNHDKKFQGKNIEFTVTINFYINTG